MKFVCLCDLDNTLLSDKEEISSISVSLLKKYLANGNKFVGISYANYQRMTKMFNKYELSCDLVSLAQGITRINGKIFTKFLPSITINTIIKEFKEDLYTFFGENEKRAYVYKYLERLKLFYPETEICKTAKLPDLFYATAIIANPKSSMFKNRLECLGLHYQSLGADAKREIIQVFAEELLGKKLLNILFNEYQEIKIIGIADSYYDYDKIQDCDIKIAMLNADDELKSKVDIISKYDNNHDGAMIALNDICHFQ